MKLCIDIGGTNIRIAIFDKNTLVNKNKFKTNANNFSQNKQELINVSNEYNDIDSISVGMPGPADYKNGILINPPNLKGWWDINLFKELKNIFNTNKIIFNNDAKLMALSNHINIGGSKKDVTQFFTISTGLGAGLIINNEIFQGSSGLAQEIAHLPTNTFDESNHLSKGAVEYYSSGSGIATRGKAFGFNSTQDVLDNYLKNSNAKKIIDEAIESLANLIASCVALINPNNIIFDGSVSRHNVWYIEKSIEIAKTRMYNNQVNSFKWYISTLEDDSVIKGALIALGE